MIGNLAVIREEGIRVLSKELGAAGMAIFLRQFENESGNYTEEREELQKNVTIDNIVERINRRNGEKI